MLNSQVNQNSYSLRGSKALQELLNSFFGIAINDRVLAQIKFKVNELIKALNNSGELPCNLDRINFEIVQDKEIRTSILINPKTRYTRKIFDDLMRL